ncbi:hypothetical protein [Lacunimicrobium album]
MKASSLKLTAVNVPEWNSKIYFKPATIEDVMSVLEKKDVEEDDVIVGQFAKIAHDENGDLIFDSEAAKDILRKKELTVVKRLFDEYNAKNLPTAIEDAKKN